MKIAYKGKFDQIKLATEDANEILNTSIFYDLIKKHDDYACSKKTPVEISDIIKNSDLEIEVKLYKPKWRFSKVLGYFVKKHPNVVFLNLRKVYRETNSITNTIIHEYIHAVDYHNNNDLIDFGHNCNSFKNTAPYKIGQLAEDIINGYEEVSNNKILEKAFYNLTEINEPRII